MNKKTKESCLFPTGQRQIRSCENWNSSMILRTSLLRTYLPEFNEKKTTRIVYGTKVNSSGMYTCPLTITRWQVFAGSRGYKLGDTSRGRKVYRLRGSKANRERVLALFTVISSVLQLHEHRLNALTHSRLLSLSARYIADNINSRVIDGSN